MEKEPLSKVRIRDREGREIQVEVFEGGENLETEEIVKSFMEIPGRDRASLFQLIYSLAGLVLGLACVIGGVILFLNGVTGSTSWTAKILGGVGLESNISDAAPGVILFIVGVFVVFITRFRAREQQWRRR